MKPNRIRSRLYFIFSKVVKQYAVPSKTNPERKHRAFMRNVKESPTQKASTLEELRRVCRPMPLTGKQLEVFFVETDLARDPHQETRRRIKGALEGGDPPRVLFYGHRGCGKSTETEQAARRTRRSRLSGDLFRARRNEPYRRPRRGLVSGRSGASVQRRYEFTGWASMKTCSSRCWIILPKRFSSKRSPGTRPCRWRRARPPRTAS